jgi:hypothetical protein
MGSLGRSREETESLLERGRRVTLSDPQGGRWMHVDPASEEYREYVEAGWR